MSELYDIDARRERLAGPAGVAGLLANKRLFGISMLTALGGLCYGYEQGACAYTICMHAQMWAKTDTCRWSGPSDAVIHPGGGFLPNRQRPQLPRVVGRVSGLYDALAHMLASLVSEDGSALSSTATAVIDSRADGLSSAAH